MGDLELCGVAEGLVPEEAADAVGQLRQPAHVADGGALELLEVLVEAGLEGGRDPDDRRTYPWGQEDTSILEFYRMLGQARRDISALRTGDYANLMYSNDLDVFAYARTDEQTAAIVVLNRSKEDRDVEVPVGGVLAEGLALSDRMNTGNEYTIQGAALKVHVPARWGALLVAK